MVTHKMSVTNLQCLVDTIADLTGSGLPCTISQLTSLKALGVYSETLLRREAYGILWPVLRVTVFPEDILKDVYGFEGLKGV